MTRSGSAAVGVKIKDVLKTHGIPANEVTTAKLAAIVGCSESTVKRGLGTSQILIIVDHFGMSRTAALQALGVLDPADLRSAIADKGSLTEASDVEILRELVARAEGNEAPAADV